MNSKYLLREELVYKLTIGGVSMESDVSLFHICSGLCWVNRPPLDSVILGKLNIEENYELISNVVDELEIIVHMTASCMLLSTGVCICVCVFYLFI